VLSLPVHVGQSKCTDGFAIVVNAMLYSPIHNP
jgi:hypothetical protein